MGEKALVILGTLLCVGGVALIATGTEVLGAIALLAGLVLGALAAAVGFVRGLLRQGRDLLRFASGGRPSEFRVVGVEPPSTVIRSPSMKVAVELTNEAGSRRLEHEVGVPRLYALGFVLARKLPFDFAALSPERLRRDLEERRIELAQQEPPEPSVQAGQGGAPG